MHLFHLEKSDVFGTFKKYKYLIENEIGKKLKCLRSDNGCEYYNIEFDNYYSYHGFRTEKIVQGTPQENGLLETKNKRIMECARCMRFHARFPLQLWVDVVDIVVYLINRGYSSSLDGGILEDAWTSKKLN